MIIKSSYGPTSLPPGWGPRHMTMTTRFQSEEKQIAYVINELEPFISIFVFDEETGNLQDLGVIETINASGSSGAEIMLHPNEQWLYCSNRNTKGENGAVLVYHVLEDGNLENVQVC